MFGWANTEFLKKIFQSNAGYLMDKIRKIWANNLNAFFNPMKADLD